MTASFPERLANGQVRAAFLTIGQPIVAESMARSPANTLFIDLEHRAMTIETAEELVRAVEATDDSVATVLRVPEGTDAWIKHALDTGADGILVPMVNSAEEAADVAAAARYPPAGRRGVAGVRAAGFGDSFDEYVADANESTAVIVQVETRAGLESAPEIAAVDGVTSLFVGPNDLTSSLAGVGSDPPADFEEAVASVRTAAHEYDCPAGIYSGDPETTAQRLSEGFDYVIAGTDLSLLRFGANAYMAPFESASQS